MNKAIVSGHKRFTLGTLNVVLVSIMLRIGTFSMIIFGDMVIQRSWMRVTLDFPIKDWYYSMPHPEYSTIDYPPVSTWHQYICGLIGHIIDPSLMDSYNSIQNFSFKIIVFMRSTVLVSEIIVFFPAAILFLDCLYPDTEKRKKNAGLLCILSSSMIFYFDYISFQYNIITVGLVIISTIFTLNKRYCISAIFLSLAVNYKVYALYFSIPFVVYWISKTIENYKTEGILGVVWKVYKIFCSGVFANVVVWFPWFETDVAFMIITRVLDFGRPYVEERVGNFWYFACTFIKFEKYMTNGSIALMCMVVTLIACLPFIYFLLKKPNESVFLYSASGCCLAFFLFSYMAKGKTAIFPSIFFSFLLVIDEPDLFQVINIIGTMNNYDNESKLLYFTCQIVFYIISTYYISNVCNLKRKKRHTVILILVVFIHFIEIFQPKDRYLNLHRRSVSTLCFGVFLYSWLYILFKLSKLSSISEKEKIT